MSIVGPPTSMASTLDTYHDDELDKMKVRPGILLVMFKYHRNELSNREKRLKDAWYANNNTFWLDVRIFFRTIATVLKKKDFIQMINPRQR